VKVQLRKLLLCLRAHQTNYNLVVQVEKEAYLESIICAFNSVDREIIMSNLPHLSLLIRNCIIEEDYDKVSLYENFSITTLTKSIPIKVGKMQVNSKPIPLEVQEHTSQALSKIVLPAHKRASSPSFSVATQSTISTTTTSSTAPPIAPPVHNHNTNIAWARNSTTNSTEERFHSIEQRLSSSETRMGHIEALCVQLKNNSDVISSQLAQLSSDMRGALDTQALPTKVAKFF
jgi:hypothetical protein